MQNFVFYNPTRIIFGPGEIARVGKEAKQLGETALIVTGKRSSSAHGIVNRITDYLEKEGVKAIVYDKIEPNPRTTTIDTAGELARRNKCDIILGVGGGQPIPKPVSQALPLAEIPTLAATGSEFNCGAVISNWETHEKAVLGNPLLFPKFSIIDPELTVTVPKDYTVDGGIDIISHVIEGFFTGADNTPVQDRFSLSIVRTVMDYLPKAIAEPGDIEARSQLSWSSAVALSGMVNNGRGGAFPLHAMEHALSAHYDISHGRGLALLLPRLMEYTYEARPKKFAMMATELFGEIADGKSELDLARLAIEGMTDFLKSVERFLRMPDVGISSDMHFEQMAEDTIRIYSGNKEYLDNPKPLYKKDIIRIFDNCM